MARRKRPENETEEEARIRRVFEDISNVASRGEKASWRRKMASLEKHLNLLRPIEDKILELNAQKQPIFDDIQVIRTTMVKECIHPYDYLIFQKDHVVCKFCNKKVSIPNGNKEA